ncbi:BatD family protein [Alteromonas gracilis]|uniref:BatD family protein n=1 Tax=Alteromonas gracilis TaxID=1479524 RepID=UPI00321AA87B
MKALSLSTLFSLIFAVFSQAVQADVNSVEATIDRNPVMLDEAIRLTVTADGSAERDAFDSSPLLKDFVVGRTSVSSQTSIVNFDTKRTTVWTTTLFPRKEGSFTIPALTIEGKQTRPIEVQVIPVQEQSNVARDYFVTTEIDTKEAYLNQQLLYTVKLFLSSNIERGSLQAPQMPNAEINQLGEDKQYTDIINGRRYQIIERQFAVVPQSSGEFTLRGPIFTGEVMAANTNQRFGFFNRTQQINRVGPDITVNIKPIPQGIDYSWLPSEMVRVDEEWPQGDTFVVGEPVTRIVTLTALGVVEEQLPDIPEFYPPNFKLYPDQSNTTTVERDQNLISQRQTSLAIIPTEAGTFVLPEITIPWFNTLTEQTEYATIPARTITVSATPNTKGNGITATNSATQVQPSSGEGTANNEQANAENASDNLASNQDKVTGAQGDTSLFDHSLLMWLTAILAAFSVASLLGWYVTHKKLQRVLKHGPSSMGIQITSKSTDTTEQEAYSQLLSVAKQHNIKELDNALQLWLSTLSGDRQRRAMPGDIPESKRIQAPIEEIHRLRFSATGGPLNNNTIKQHMTSLIHAVKETRKEWLSKNKSPSNTLSDLYPAS